MAGANPDKPRRSYGTGRVYIRRDANGRETYYGSWWVGTRRVNRKLGVKRAVGERDGLTAAQAEAELRRRMADEAPRPTVGERIDVAELGRRYRRHLEAQGREKSTLTAVESRLRLWVCPVLGDRAIGQVTPEDVEDLMRTMSPRLGRAWRRCESHRSQAPQCRRISRRPLARRFAFRSRTRG